jgi:hypothetical protein
MRKSPALGNPQTQGVEFIDLVIWAFLEIFTNI